MCNFFVSGTCSARESLLRYSNFVNVTYNYTFVFNSTSPITSVPRFSEYDGICVRSLNITLTQRPRNRKLENICKVCTRQILSFPSKIIYACVLYECRSKIAKTRGIRNNDSQNILCK